MPKSSVSVAKSRFTSRDIHLASLIYPVLIDLAKSYKCMTYKQLVSALQRMHTDDPVAQSMLPIQSGRILGVIYLFAEQHNLPRLSSLIIGAKGQCGGDFSQTHDCKAERERCFFYDWEAKQPAFWDFIDVHKQRIKAAKPAPKITVDQASSTRWDYYSKNKFRMKPNARKFGQAVLDALLKGVPPELAFAPYMLVE